MLDVHLFTIHKVDLGFWIAVFRKKNTSYLSRELSGAFLALTSGSLNWESSWQKILPELKDDRLVDSHDSSTNGLINTFKELKK